MGAAAWVCFECRNAVRRNTQYAGDVPCPNCGRLCAYLGYRIRVPPKRKRREWSQLHEQLSHERTAQAMSAYLDRNHERIALSREIERLEAKGPNPGRDAMIRRLRRRLEWFDHPTS
jgi:hypothetical protein